MFQSSPWFPGVQEAFRDDAEWDAGMSAGLIDASPTAW